MGTKQALIEEAYQDIGIEPPIEQARLDQGLRVLNGMMGAWLNKGLDVGFLIDNTPDLADETGLLQQDEYGVVTNLAVQLAGRLSISIDPQYRAAAKEALDNFYIACPPTYCNNPFMPLGQGNRTCYGFLSPAYQQSTESECQVVDSDCNSLVDENGFEVGT